jgi:hypothetical protein
MSEGERARPLNTAWSPPLIAHGETAAGARAQNTKEPKARDASGLARRP